MSKLVSDPLAYGLIACFILCYIMCTVGAILEKRRGK